MPNHRIEVTVDKDSIRVSPETLSMTMADDVQWTGTNSKKFSIVFDEDGVFGQRTMGHSMATAAQKARRRGRFKYSVVSEDDPGLMLDPIIIVGDPPTDPNT